MRTTITKYLPEFVYGSIDGTVTTFAIVSGIAGAALSPSLVLILGVANVLADGFSMASSNYLSERSRGAGEKIVSVKTALATFFSFVLVGFIPLIPYIFNFTFFNYSNFEVSCVFTGLTFLSIGYVRGYISKMNRLAAALETLLIGGVAAGISFFVGYFLRGLV